MSEHYIGLMSGTSLDGVDGVLVSFSEDGSQPTVQAHAHRPFTPGFYAELLALNEPGPDEIHRAGLAANALGLLQAEVVEALLQAAGIDRRDVRALGSHGQTVRHRPGEFDDIGYTLQLNNPSLLAECCGIDVIADLRSRDVAAGGQGAPLVPAFHRSLFARPGHAVAVLNIGGISNLTALGADGSTTGFDCGPGNGLMDHWCRRHTGQPYDDAGRWAETGRVDRPLLQRFLADPYFSLPPPKSTGRDRFNPEWLDLQIAQNNKNLAPADVQATLVELTAATCADSVRRTAEAAAELLVCGGGAYNLHLIRRLQANLPNLAVMTTDARGLPANQVEACAFAWLARAFTKHECANLPAVTGARGPRLLGALYPA